MAVAAAAHHHLHRVSGASELAIGRSLSHRRAVVIGLLESPAPLLCASISSTHYATRNGDTLAFVPACITPVLCNAEALDVSGDGLQVVGFSQGSAVRWDISAGTAVALSPGTDSKALGISADGTRIVGYAIVGESVAMTWTDQGARSVQDVLGGAGVTSAGWQLTVARAASQDGQVIVGDGINPQGQTEGWIAVLPRGR
jgi:uncharacterized membrane protein